jgi:uncharacterized protein YdhG (YjbR/CyaY superfamily)
VAAVVNGDSWASLAFANADRQPLAAREDFRKLVNEMRAKKIKTTARSIDEYLAALNAEQRAALEKLRKIIRDAAPNAEECISYQLAAFRHDGRMLVALGATTNHCALYLMSTTAMGPYRAELEDYDTSKGTIRFPADKPLPAALVRKLVKVRIAENASTGRKPRK